MTNWIFYTLVGIGTYLWLYCAAHLTKAGFKALRLSWRNR
jgi:hypothetical protein